MSKPFNPVELGRILNTMRHEHGIGPRQFCEIVGIASETLYNVEGGPSAPKIHTLIKIAKLYKVPKARFLDTFFPGLYEDTRMPDVAKLKPVRRGRPLKPKPKRTYYKEIALAPDDPTIKIKRIHTLSEHEKLMEKYA